MPKKEKYHGILSKEYIEEHPLNMISSPHMFWMLICNEEFRTELKERDKEGHSDPLQEDLEKAIEGETDPKVLFRYMRKMLDNINRGILMKQIYENEEEMMPILKKHILTSRVDHFIERTTEAFIFGKENPAEWIREHYFEVAEPYTQSLLCLVLGYRGSDKDVPFLKEEVDRLNVYGEEKKEDALDQGPLIALYLLDGREDEL